MNRRDFVAGVAGNLLLAPGLLQAATRRVPRRKDATRPLDALPPNTARNVGPYATPDIPGAIHITDYSGMVSDPGGARMLLFGGGHGPSNETDIRAFDVATLRWSSLYPTTPYSAMTAANCDTDLGRWKSTNHPTARHTYNLNVVLGRRLYVMTARGMPYLPEQQVGESLWGGRLCSYDFDTGAWRYSRYRYSGAPQVPWGFTAAAVADPRSEQILVVGYGGDYSPGNAWVYDPASDLVKVLFQNGPDVGAEHDIVYFPPTDRFYVLQSDGRVWELEFDRATPTRSRLVPLEVSGTRPTAEMGAICAYAYDPVNQVIGGNVIAGTFHAFDPATRAWTATRMQVESGALVPNQAFHCLDFDPDSGCYVFLSDAASATTWAYRPPQRSRTAVTGANPVADLAVSLDFGGGRVATFSGRDATDQGDFVGQFVRQKSYLAVDPAFPDWRVYLRVDADASGARIAEPAAGWRDEVIVEYGRSTHGAPAHVTAAYTATITKGGQVRATQSVPKHWWYARWRWQSAERRVVRTPAEIKARGWIPNFGAGGLFGLAANRDAVRWDGPMCAPVRQAPLQAFNPYMPSGGDNPQIGFLTEYAADYVLTGSDASLRSVRTEGEWCGNWCMHVRDDRTGAPLDVRGGALQWKSNKGTVNDAPAGNSNTDPNFVSLDCAHFYPCANLPWLLTEDPFYLEELQFGVNWHLLYNNWPRERLKLQGLMYPDQTRAYAWGLRQLFLVAATTPASTPGWLRPQRYWRDCVADNKAFAMQFVRSPARIHKLFRTWTVSDMVPAWQCAWLNAVVGMAVDQGFLDWGPVFAWGVDLHIQQSNGKSGWPRQWPVPYYSMPNRVGYNTYVALPYTDTAPDATTCTSWADYWVYYASGSDGHSDTTGHRIDPTGWDGRTIMQQFYDVGPSYLLHLRAVLAVAVTRRIPGAQACYDYIQGELTQSVMPHYGNHEGQARFSIDPDPHPRVAASFEGLWKQAGANDGWTLSVEHQAEVILAGWFTFDAAGAPRWLSLIAGKADADHEVYTGSLYRTSGPPFDAMPFDPGQVMRNVVGAASLTFADGGSGTFDAVVDGKPFSAPIARYAFADPAPACGFGVLQDLTEATNYQGVWWAAPAESESGWGVSIAHQGDVLLATWFTYDAAGQPLWLSAVAPQAGPADYVGTLYESRAAAGSSPVQRAPAGAVAFTFLDGNDGQFTYSYQGVTQTRAITREVFRLPGTVCET